MYTHTHTHIRSGSSYLLLTIRGWRCSNAPVHTYWLWRVQCLYIEAIDVCFAVEFEPNPQWLDCCTHSRRYHPSLDQQPFPFSIVWDVLSTSHHPSLLLLEKHGALSLWCPSSQRQVSRMGLTSSRASFLPSPHAFSSLTLSPSQTLLLAFLCKCFG